MDDFIISRCEDCDDPVNKKNLTRCPECKKWLCPECLRFFHDCTDGDDFRDPRKREVE